MDEQNKNLHAEYATDKSNEAIDPGAQQCSRCEEYLAGWKRCQADYANLKKEIDREKAEFSKYANELLLASLLPAIEQFETALAHTPNLPELSEEASTRLENWILGVQAVKNIWEGTFQTLGLEKIIPTGEFDPLIHEAVAHESSDTIPDGHILRVIQGGWRLHGKLLRPAQVIVSQHTTHSTTGVSP